MKPKNSKYEPLTEYLKAIQTGYVVMTFEELKEVLGFKLPPSASKHQAWWDEASQHTQAYAWLNAGYRARVNMKEKKVEFVKI